MNHVHHGSRSKRQLLCNLPRGCAAFCSETWCRVSLVHAGQLPISDARVRHTRAKAGVDFIPCNMQTGNRQRATGNGQKGHKRDVDNRNCVSAESSYNLSQHSHLISTSVWRQTSSLPRQHGLRCPRSYQSYAAAAHRRYTQPRLISPSLAYAHPSPCSLRL